MVLTSVLPPAEWKASDEFDPIPFEKVIGINNLLSIAWLSQGLTLAAPVARIVIPNDKATGFLIAPDLLLTNNHVLPSPQDAEDAIIEFNYQTTWAGVLAPVRRFSTDSTYFRTNEELDYTMVRVTGAPGDFYGYIDLNVRAGPSVNDYVSVIQHPMGGPKQIAFTDNKVSAVFGNKVQHSSDTEPGSSGSPVFNQSWQIVALHHAGGRLSGPDGAKHFTNEGILIGAVIADAADFLGLSDPLYDLAFAELRSVLVNLIDLVEPPNDPGALLPDLLRTQPLFPSALDQWSALNVKPEEDAATALGGAGVAIGAALRQWSRSSGHESIKAAAPSTPPPSDALVAVVSRFHGTSDLPSHVYATVLSATRTDASLVAPLEAVARGGTGLTAIAATFLTGVVMGAKAYDPAPA